MGPCVFINTAEYREVHNDNIRTNKSPKQVNIEGHPMPFLRKSTERWRQTAPTRLQAGTRRKCVVTITLRLIYPRERPGSHTTGGRVGLGAGLGGMENLAPTGTWSPDRLGGSVVAIPTKSTRPPYTVENAVFSVLQVMSTRNIGKIQVLWDKTLSQILVTLNLQQYFCKNLKSLTKMLIFF